VVRLNITPTVLLHYPPRRSHITPTSLSYHSHITLVSLPHRFRISPHQPINPENAMASMQLRKNRTTNNPGLVDLPNPRRSSSDVAAEKQKKQETAAAKAKGKEAQVARVARLEKEIKVAQQEAAQSSRQVGRRGRAKKTFECDAPLNEVEEVSSFQITSKIVPTAHPTLQNPGPGLKRKATVAQLSEFERTKSAKVAKYVLEHFSLPPTQLTIL